ncbi:MAG: hypothetical protein LBU91_00360 [Bacteroidales bacterium]|jgi:hypothetical protein|nr:hypothetical protein [Bacteroidales bacterium]
MGKLLLNFEAFDLWKIEREDLTDFTKFVVQINYEHHLQTSAPAEEIEAYIKKDEHIFDENAHFYALKTKNGQIFGTINAHLTERGTKIIW